MELIDILVTQGNTREEAEDMVNAMVSDFNAGMSPDDVLLQYGIDADFEFELIYEASKR